MKLRWLSPALAQLDHIYGYIQQENPTAAKQVFTRIRHATRHLVRFPESGRRGQVPGTRELIVSDLPYIVVYRVTETEVQVLRVWHTGRDLH
jgi:addiction module RelE/StbE family toxin